MEEHNSERKLGRKMLYVSWILVLAGLTYVFGLWEKHQYNPNQTLVSSKSDDVREVTLQRNRFDHYVASGSINNTPVVFILDTGATDVAVPAGLAEKLNLEKGMSGYAITANGRVKIHKTRIDKLNLGPIVLHNVSASINPGMDGDEVLLGMSVLRQLDFSQSGDQLTLRQKASKNQ